MGKVFLYIKDFIFPITFANGILQNPQITNSLNFSAFWMPPLAARSLWGLDCSRIPTFRNWTHLLRTTNGPGRCLNLVGFSFIKFKYFTEWGESDEKVQDKGRATEKQRRKRWCTSGKWCRGTSNCWSRRKSEEWRSTYANSKVCPKFPAILSKFERIFLSLSFLIFIAVEKSEIQISTSNESKAYSIPLLKYSSLLSMHHQVVLLYWFMIIFLFGPISTFICFVVDIWPSLTHFCL